MVKTIYNKENNIAEIDLVGDFGDYFFDEITKDKLLNFLNEHPKSDIVANISSLGGSVDVAFAISDFVKNHKGHTTARLFGRNASSSTVFSSVFDNVEMSDNGLFLIHNVWAGAVGNAEEIRKMADDMDKHDDVIVNIYRKKTGLSDKKIKNLMKKAKWYNAKEAQEMGFIDKIINTDNEIENSNINTIYNKYLPNLNKMENTGNTNLTADDRNWFEKLVNKTKPEVKDISDEIKTDFENQITGLNSEKTTLENSLSEVTAKNTELTNSIKVLNNEKEAQKIKITDLEAKIAKEVAKPTSMEKEEDALEGAELTDSEKSWLKDAASFKGKL